MLSSNIFLPPEATSQPLPDGESPFQGFSLETFGLLGRLEAAPHISTYRSEHGNIREYLDGPFKAYRDALVLSWVLPNQLPFETERNVFSRLSRMTLALVDVTAINGWHFIGRDLPGCRTCS